MKLTIQDLQKQLKEEKDARELRQAEMHESIAD